MNPTAWQLDRRLVGEGDHVLAAVSGGPDSMALLHALRAARDSFTLTAAHFDHRLREDSGRDRDFVERICARWDIPLRTGSGDVRARAGECGESIEEAARHLRYEFLETTADAVGANRIAVAHTLDDHIETVLMRLRRGSGVRGLRGIPARRGRIVRPLLSARRDDVIAYCEANCVPSIDDPSNRDLSFERNRIRHEVLPAMRTLAPGTEAGLLWLADEASGVLASIRRVTDAVVETHLRQEDEAVWTLAVPPVRALDATARYVLFGDVLYHRLGCTAELGRAHYHTLFDVVDGAASGAALPGLSVRREHDDIVFSRAVSTEPRAPAGVLTLPGETTALGYRVRARVLPESGRDGAWTARTRGRWESGGEVTSAVAYFAREAVAAPFTVRPVVPGDRMRPFGMIGHKKLSDIFIDRKIPYRHRHRVPVVEDRHGIVWLAGVTTSEPTRVITGTTHVVELAIEIE